MTIDKFIKINKINNKKKVANWIKVGLIPGADLENNYVPDSARIPYTEARAKNAKSIYVSMVKGSSERKHILPKIYNLCDEEFDGYVDRLIRAGLLEKRISDNITYYDATIKGSEINKKSIMQTIESISRVVAEGITNAILNKIGG